MKKGWYKSPRALFDEPVGMTDGLFRIFHYCIAKANYEDGWAVLKIGSEYTQIPVKRGQFIGGRKSIARGLNLPESTVRNRLKRLVELECLDMETTSHYSVITVKDYDRYQGREGQVGHETGQAKDGQGTTRGQREDTDKNPKNSNKEKNKIVVFRKKIPEMTSWEICTGILAGGEQEESARRSILDYVPSLSLEEIELLASRISDAEEEHHNQRFLEMIIREIIDARQQSQAVGGG